MKSKIRIWLAIVALTLFVGSALGWSHFRNSRASLYLTTPVTRGVIHSTVGATGTLNAVVTVQVGSQVSGDIKGLYADFNTKVTKGQLVALIDPEIFQARVNQAKANLDNARESVINAQAGEAKAQADIVSAQAARDNAKAQLAKTQADSHNAGLQLQRSRSLLAKGLMDKQDADTAQASYDGDAATVRAAQAQVQSADSNIKAAQAEYKVAQAQVAAMQTQVRQFQAALAQTELDLEHTQIRAPVDGTVIARHMDVGQTVAASFQAPTIFEIAEDLTKMQVDTNVDEADIGAVQLGQPASFTVDAFPGEIFKADVSQIRKAPINVQNVITYDVVLRVDNADLKLLPGMTANVKILTNTLNDTLKVPNAALRFKPRGSDSSATSKSSGTQTIYMLVPHDVLQPVQVSAGLSDGNLTAISGGGVREGDRVIVGYAQASSTENGTRFPRGPSF